MNATTAPAVHAVVVGSGIAGLTAALHAVKRGCRVTLVTKDVLEHANTRYAQGGIAGVMFDDDRIEDHIRDTITAGAGLSDPDAVRVLAAEGPARIRDLIALGVAFDRAPDGTLVKGLEAAHSYPRILHAGGDATGTAVEKALVARLRESGVTVVEHAFLVDLAVDAGRVRGVKLLVGGSADRMGERRLLAADAVVLATGGAGELYSHSTNPSVATGDGIAAALRAGAAVTDLEFFQFHPTVLPEDDQGEAFLVSEAVRGEGATLIDDAGRRFVFDVHPDGELAPRDVVAAAIAQRMARQDGRPVRLDATHLRPTLTERRAFLARRFPTIDAAVHRRGWDWAAEPVPVTPAAHYLMGGVVTDLRGRTSLPGLYAVGEVARTGVHGANRLASNSLLEGAVFGARAGDTIAADTARDWPSTPGVVPNATPALPIAVVAPPPFDRAALQDLLWTLAGLVRTERGLAEAAAVLRAWSAAAPAASTEREYEDANLLLVGTHLVAAARARRESIGAHVRADASRPVSSAPTEPMARAASC
ncbi:L-aspartate oxidase [Microbacterium sp. ET2]|uniref:L-aspartate oxidase n=1 Tax=Microbacterium albipurpureum TaxID=3050384 RepID=UPI00259CF0B4|nr:L-aspartate oxidase [Microbacterium sp. ET2 (Ac-2212)]WJL95961.1 L-aspartate oxidase [Microbacterium sp. ET2 (Ac-2212)]